MAKAGNALYRSFFCILLLVLPLLSCANNYEKLEAFYYGGQYLEAAQAAYEGYQDNAKIKQKVILFLGKFGDRLVNKSIEQSVLYLKDLDTDTGIRHTKQLISIYENMTLLDMPVSNLETGLLVLNQLLTKGTKSYIEYHYSQGKKALDNKLFRKSLEHFKSVQSYYPQYEKSNDYRLLALKQAKRHIVITPFYHPTDPFSKALTRALAKILVGESPSEDSILKSPIILEGLHIDDRFTNHFLRELNQHKSDYLTFSIQGENSVPSNSEYVTIGLIDLIETDLIDNPIKEQRSDVLRFETKSTNSQYWEEAYFTYDIFKISYSVRLNVNLSLYISNQKELITQINTEQEAKKIHEYVGDTQGLPNFTGLVNYPRRYEVLPTKPFPIHKKEVILEAIELTATDLAAQLLQVIDKDLDPFEIERK